MGLKERWFVACANVAGRVVVGVEAPPSLVEGGWEWPLLSVGRPRLVSTTRVATRPFKSACHLSWRVGSQLKSRQQVGSQQRTFPTQEGYNHTRIGKWRRGGIGERWDIFRHASCTAIICQTKQTIPPGIFYFEGKVYLNPLLVAKALLV